MNLQPVISVSTGYITSKMDDWKVKVELLFTMCSRSTHATWHDDNNQCSQNIRHAFTDWWKWPFILRVWQAHQQSLHLLLLVAGQDFSPHVWHLCAQVAFRGQFSLLLFLGPFTLWPGLVSRLTWFVLGLSRCIFYTFDPDQAWIRFMSSSFQTHHLSAMMLITNGRSFASQVYHYISVQNHVTWHTMPAEQSKVRLASIPGQTAKCKHSIPRPARNF